MARVAAVKVEATRTSILDAAGSVLRERGYASLSTLTAATRAMGLPPEQSINRPADRIKRIRHGSCDGIGPVSRRAGVASSASGSVSWRAGAGARSGWTGLV